MARLSHAAYPGYYCVYLECCLCGAAHFAWYLEASDEWPIKTAQCSECSRSTCAALGPPVISMN